MQKVISVTVRDRIASAPKDAEYICGNSDFSVVFDFDTEWADQKVKTARFIWNGKWVDVVFTGNKCDVPVISDTFGFVVGVYAGDLRTTTPAYVKARKSILCGTGVPADPEEDVYRQIMRLVEGVVEPDAAVIVGAVYDYLDEHLSSLVETDPTVPDWAKQVSKPGYTADEVGADKVGSADAAVNLANQYTDSQIELLNKELADLKYSPIEIASFSHNLPTQELGAVVSTVTLAWALSKAPVSLKLDGATVDPTLREKTLTGQAIKGNKTFALTATDERNAVASKTVSIVFYNGVYYGAAGAQPVNGDLIRGLSNKVLTGTRARTIKVNAAEGQRIWYALPTRLGKCTFKVGGFEGGFNLAGTVDFKNPSGHTEPYYIYCSAQSGLGETTVEVS